MEKTTSQRVIITFALLAIMILASCSGNGSSNQDAESNDSIQDEQLNDSIQGRFFDTEFGASKEEVIRNFEAHELRYRKNDSTDDALLFMPKAFRTNFTFGGFSWDYVRVYINNGVFYAIEFNNAHKDKASAIQDYDALYERLTAKYVLNNESPSDTTVYKRAVGRSKTERSIAISCHRYESVSRDIYIGVSLAYADLKYYSEVNDEL